MTMKLLFDFDQLAGAGAARIKYRIAQAFERYNTDLAGTGKPGGGGQSVEINPTIRRSSGIPYREVQVMMKDGQRVLLRIKSPGDVFQVLVNGRALAIKNQDDHQAAIREIVDQLNSGRAAFQKRMGAVRAPMKRGLAVSSRMQSKQLKAKLIVLDTLIEDARAELAELGVVEATPITQPEPPPAAALVPEPTAPAAPAPSPEPQADPAQAPADPEPLAPLADQWLRDLVEGRTKIEGDLKGWRDRIREALKDPSTTELAQQAYKLLGAAAMAEAQRIVAGGA